MGLPHGASVTHNHMGQDSRCWYEQSPATQWRQRGMCAEHRWLLQLRGLGSQWKPNLGRQLEPCHGSGPLPLPPSPRHFLGWCVCGSCAPLVPPQAHPAAGSQVGPADCGTYVPHWHPNSRGRREMEELFAVCLLLSREGRTHSPGIYYNVGRLLKDAVQLTWQMSATITSHENSRQVV